MKLKNTFICILILCSCMGYGQNKTNRKQTRHENHLIDSTLRAMSIEEKVGQMFIPSAFISSEKEYQQALQMIEKYHVGGLSLYRNNISPLVDFINQANTSTKTPLFVAMTFERGLAMRIDGMFNYPWNMTLGALDNDSLISKMARRVGEQCKRLGVNFNFAPVVDVNTNALNPIIGMRSFGSNPKRVAQKSIAYIQGLQGTGVLGSVKHYPGHGDTSQDSHKVLPSLEHSKERMNKVELYPFKKTLKSGVASLMVGHLSVPSMEKDPKLPSSLSKRVVNDVLRNKWEYNGLIITDALNMKGLSSSYPSGIAEIMAIEAGADLLLYSEDIDKAYNAVLEKAKNNKKFYSLIEHSVLRILKAKQHLPSTAATISKEDILQDINSQQDSILHLQIMENAVTLLKNKHSALPMVDLADKQMFWLALGDGDNSVFERYIKIYNRVEKLSPTLSANELIASLPNKATVIVSYHCGDEGAFGSKEISKEDKDKIKALGATSDNVFVLLDSPYQLLDTDMWDAYKSVLLSYQNSWAAQIASAEAVFGGIGTNGILPVDISNKYREGDGIRTKAVKSLKFGFAEQAGIDSSKMFVVDSLLADIVSSGAAPGGRMLILRSGRVVVDKCFGTTMYEDSLSIPVSYDMVYDLASVSKVSATLPMIMMLEQQGKINLNSTLSELLPQYKGSNKEDIKLKEILTHCGGLPGGLGFYNWTLDPKTKKPSAFFYSEQYSDEYPLQVGASVFMRKDYSDTVTNRIYSSRILPKEYKYSDLDFYLLREIVDQYYPNGIDGGTRDEFYAPMGAWSMGYLPLRRVAKEKIAPTMIDTWFRNELVQGYVHDGGAAMLGGVSGHAGNFSSGYDLAKYCQMLLQGGYYGGKRLLDKSTVDKFTSYYKGVDQGSHSLGFVKRSLEDGGYDDFLSRDAFWHTGWTGTLMLVEPKYDLVYVLLSNRTYGEKKAGLFSENSYRFKILKAVIDSFKTHKDK